MNRFIHRYEIDSSSPSGKEFWRDIALRALVPAAAVWVLIVGLGFLITGPLNNLPGEVTVSRWFVDQRTGALNTITHVISEIGNTTIVFVLAVITMALLWWWTKQWWFALIPGLAIGLQLIVFLPAALVVGRERPDVDHLDGAPPTSSYPSGHTGASTALYVSLALVAQRIQNRALRVVVTVVLLLFPLTMGTVRLYRGMHGVSDVIAGLLNGILCALIAWSYLRRDTSGAQKA